MTAKKPRRKKPRELTVAQKLAFRMPINQARSEAHVPPPAPSKLTTSFESLEAPMTDLPAAIAAAPTCVTLNAIREHDPCACGWKNLLAHLGKTQADEEPLPLLTILESNGFADAIWAMRALSDADMPKARLFAVACARDVQHLMADPRSIAALDVAERYANGLATEAELATARDAADAAAWAAARAAAEAAAWAARDAAREKQRGHFIRIFGDNND